MLTAQNGAGLANFGGPGTPQQWTIIESHAFGAGTSVVMPNDKLTFAKGAVGALLLLPPPLS